MWETYVILLVALGACDTWDLPDRGVELTILAFFTWNAWFRGLNLFFFLSHLKMKGIFQMVKGLFQMIYFYYFSMWRFVAWFIECGDFGLFYTYVELIMPLCCMSCNASILIHHSINHGNMRKWTSTILRKENETPYFYSWPWARLQIDEILRL